MPRTPEAEAHAIAEAAEAIEDALTDEGFQEIEYDGIETVRCEHPNGVSLSIRIQANEE